MILYWTLYLKIIDGNYEIIQAGSDIVPTQSYDKVLPTTERIARQPEKVYFDGEKLNVKENETLLSIEELNAQIGNQYHEKEQEIEIFDIEN